MSKNNITSDNLKTLLSPFNQVLNDPSMTYEAKGMLLLLYSLDDLDNLSTEKLISASSSSRDKTRRIFKELMSAGFVSKILMRHEDGTFSHNQYFLNTEKLKTVLTKND